VGSGVPLSPRPLPQQAARLLALAEHWGLADDVERSMKLESASPTELRALVEQVASAGDPLHDWITASCDFPSDPRYVSLTALTMAADEARVILHAPRDGD
jgi:hypothetical protein